MPTFQLRVILLIQSKEDIFPKQFLNLGFVLGGSEDIC